MKYLFYYSPTQDKASIATFIDLASNQLENVRMAFSKKFNLGFVSVQRVYDQDQTPNGLYWFRLPHGPNGGSFELCLICPSGTTEEQRGEATKFLRKRYDPLLCVRYLIIENIVQYIGAYDNLEKWAEEYLGDPIENLDLPDSIKDCLTFDYQKWSELHQDSIITFEAGEKLHVFRKY